jgi:hypothetical protein
VKSQLRGPVSDLALSEEEAFSVLVECGERLRAGSELEGVARCFVVTPSGHLGPWAVTGSSPPYLPQQSDRSLARFHRRVSGLVRRLGGNGYGIVVNQVPLLRAFPWARVRAGLAALGADLPAARVLRPAIFLGHYPVTPYGVHADPGGTLVLPIRGRKRMLTWSADYATEHPALQFSDGRAHRRAATTLEVGPGGALHWPAGEYHVAMNAGGFCASVHYLAEPRSPINEALRVLRARARGSDADDAPGAVAALRSIVNHRDFAARVQRVWEAPLEEA